MADHDRRPGWTSALVMAALAAAHAPSSPAADIEPMAKVGFELGGDTLVEMHYADGSTQKMRANDGIVLGGGALIGDKYGGIEAEISLSYKLGLLDAKNSDVRWSRMPLDILIFSGGGGARLGLGITYHLNPRLRSSGAAGDLDIRYDPAPGILLQWDHVTRDRTTIGVRFTSVRYQPRDGGAGVKSNGLGVMLGAAF